MRDTAVAARSGEFESGAGQIDTKSVAEGAQQVEIVSSAAAAVEDPEIGAPGSGAFEQRGNESAETAKPEMLTLGASGCFKETVHSRFSVKNSAFSCKLPS